MMRKREKKEKGMKRKKKVGRGQRERTERVLQRVKNRVRYTERQVSQVSKW